MSRTRKLNTAREIARCKLDPFYFITKYIKIEVPGSTIEMKPYPKQLELIRTILQDHYVCVLKSRQIGISTIIQAFCVYLTTFFKNISIGIISRDGPEATDFARKCRIMFESLPDWMRPRYIKRTEQTYELTNSSRIIASPVNLSNPEGVFRGKVLTFLVIDEAAFIRKIEEAFVGISPALTTAHRIARQAGIPYGTIILSTPNGTSGTGKWFYDMYIKAKTNQSIFKAMTIHYSEAPFADKQWLETQKKILLASKGPEAIDQELELKFISSSDSFFEQETFSKLQEVVDKPIEPIKTIERVYFNKFGERIGEGQWNFWEMTSDQKFYFIGVDVAPSYGTCNSAIEIIDQDLQQVAEFAGKLRISDLENEIKFIVNIYQNCLLVVEANSYASQLVERLEEDDFISARLYYREKRDNKGKVIARYPGFMTDSKTRPKLMEALYWKIKENPESIKSIYLARELMSLEKSTRSNSLTDRLISYALALYVPEFEPDKVPDVKTTFNREDIDFYDNIFQDRPKDLKEVLIQEKKILKKKELTEEELENYIFYDIEPYDPVNNIEVYPLDINLF